MELLDWFGPEVACAYDNDDDVRFTPDHVRMESRFLADFVSEGGRALEFAIGTGRVALPLRERGVDVEGIDLSEAMLARLRAKPHGADVRVVIGDFSSTFIGAGFDLVYLVFNTLGNITTQDGQVATFANAARHLRPGGCFVVEIQMPGVLRAQHGGDFRVFHHHEHGVSYDEYNLVTQHMYSHHVRLGPDRTGTRRSIPFRYVWPAEMDLMARLAGMQLRERWGWWDRSPFTSSSPSHVSVWQTPAPVTDPAVR